jgi:hypothetical protein
MISFYEYSGRRRSCETRLSADGIGFELVVTDLDEHHVERFDDIAALLAREHELLAAWKALGWRILSPAVSSAPKDRA